MDEIEIIRKITTLMYAIRHEVHCHAIQKDSIRHRDMMVLDTILRHENCIKMSDLSSCFAITKAAISQEVKHLEELGWVCRQKKEDDKRSVFICVTQQGKDILLQQQEEKTKRFIHFINELGPEDTQALMRILEKGLETFKERGNIC